MSDVETFYCLIVGSRSFSDYELFVAKCDLLLRNWGSVVIVSGGARGADALAKRYAVDRGYCYMEFPADWDTYGRRAGYIRNRAMHEYISTHAMVNGSRTYSVTRIQILLWSRWRPLQIGAWRVLSSSW